MSHHQVTIREIIASDIQSVVGYWTGAPLSYLEAMGIDTTDLSRFDAMAAGIQAELEAPYSAKKTLHLIAEFGGQAIGHVYVNNVNFGEAAFIHLHLWRGTPKRQKLGSRMVAAGIPYFFEKLELKELLCEPAAANPAPNRTIERLGFSLVKTYETVPAGWNFLLEVNQWRLSREKYQELFRG
jgi:RimJ/RimL family protein N-acetyltransferase